MQLLPMLGMGSSVVFFFMPGAPPFMKIMGVLMMVSTVGMAIAQIVRHRQGTQGQMADVRRDYLKYLAQTRRDGAPDRARASATRSSICTRRRSSCGRWSPRAAAVWERRAERRGLRAGADRASARSSWPTPLVAPRDRAGGRAGAADARARCSNSSRRTASLDDLPMAVSLRAFYHVTVSGDPETVHGTARALVGQLATLHSPEDLVDRGGRRRRARRRSGTGRSGCRTRRCRARSDGAGTRRLFGDDLGELEELLADAAGGPSAVQPGRAAGARPAASWWSCSTAALVPPDSVLAGGRGPAGRDRRRGGPGRTRRAARRAVGRRAAGPAAAGVAARRGVRGHARTSLSLRGRGGAGPAAGAAAHGRAATTTNRCSPTWTSPIC